MITPDAGGGAIRFGILYSGAALEYWQIRCLEQLTALPEVRAEVSIAPERFRVPLDNAWAELPNIPIEFPERADEAASLDSAARGRLRAAALDFILCFADGRLPADILELPRYGAWRFHLGDWVNYRGPAPGFWEVYDGCAVSAALLVRLLADADAVDVLRECFLRTRTLSVPANREQLFDRVAHWPAQVCRAIGLGRFEVIYAKRELRSRAAARPRPALRHRAALAGRIALRIAASGFRSLFRHDQWNIGIVDSPVEEFLSAGGPRVVRWLPPTPAAEFRADPFGTSFAGRPTILCEHYSYRDDLGYIVAIDVEQGVPGSRVKIGPEQPVHLSYPFVFEAEGRLLCVPESSAAQEIALYAAEHFPGRWTRIATLIAGRGFVDATLFQYEGRWWLAASGVAAKGANSELHLWFAGAPSGPWEPHIGNPVKIDVRSARPAGTPFWSDGALYRPAQDCSTAYGARVIINRVVALTPVEFREVEAAAVNPDPRGKYPAGLHTLSSWGDKTLIDGKRSVFAAAQFFRVLKRYLQ